ncbi:MAG: hypothetical protein COT92_03840 [Candidatus Doudnabacteria bacterium CG10_big_fil_rev_8_21_14_0_10_42_18]|uniref:Uncharacterized protein n=1 Tax=Candidatus Doudnabacteria bacterium CG10_big_fil_rev_8_21_14_0_10_42_18 TaxID=1974552 RepID=A0A2H0VA21_9BACT|nr:MAG: hypothetical protein COT92_03840 [Candidatus Doudnabacteria bacterium CG10_big_fil_rev_8_21_14_0_10_42_18]
MVKVSAVVLVVLTFCFGFAYVVGQQVMRSMADDPQVEIAENVIDVLNQGQDPQAIGSATPTDISNSLSAFVLVYDSGGEPISGTGLLNGDIPAVPRGVFDAARQKGEGRLTWQLQENVRIAAVVKPFSYNGEDSSSEGYVLAGRNLRETENHTQNLLKLTIIAWAVALTASLIIINLLLMGKKEEYAREHEHHHEGEHHHKH